MPCRNADGTWPQRGDTHGSVLWLDATELPEKPPPCDEQHAHPYDEYAKRPGRRTTVPQGSPSCGIYCQEHDHIRCGAALNIAGEHFWCDLVAGHAGWAHSNKEAQTLWTDAR